MSHIEYTANGVLTIAFGLLVNELHLQRFALKIGFTTLPVVIVRFFGKHTKQAHARLFAALLGTLVAVAPSQLAVAQTASGHVVSDAKYTSPYDAFMKMNRLQEVFAKGQSASEYWGVMESRLGNQAGRILIKRPAKGFDDDAFRGWVMFIRAYGNATGIGNCAACHSVPEFYRQAEAQHRHRQGANRDADRCATCTAKRHSSTTAARSPWRRPSPGTWKTGESPGTIKRAGVEIAVGQIALTDDEVRQMAVFLRSLNNVDRSKFRDYLVDVVIQPVELEFSD